MPYLPSVGSGVGPGNGQKFFKETRRIILRLITVS
jgi:hypothetical protein